MESAILSPRPPSRSGTQCQPANPTVCSVCGIRELRLDLRFETLTDTLGGGRVHLDRTTVSFISRNLISRALESYRGHLESLGAPLIFHLRDGPSLPGMRLLPWTTAAEPSGHARVHGNLSLLLPHDTLLVQASGFPHQDLVNFFLSLHQGGCHIWA